MVLETKQQIHYTAATVTATTITAITITRVISVTTALMTTTSTKHTRSISKVTCRAGALNWKEKLWCSNRKILSFDRMLYPRSAIEHLYITWKGG